MVRVGNLDLLASLTRPLGTLDDRALPVPDELAGILPPGGIRRGSTVGVGPMSGGCSVSLAMAAAVTRQGGWVAAVGLAGLGMVAAAEIGVDLGRMALVPEPGDGWATVVAALLDGFDMLMLRPPGRVRSVEARRLVARARERGSVLLLLDASRWPESADVEISVARSRWEGLGEGHGCLTGRRLELRSSGRRMAGRSASTVLWLPVPRALPGTPVPTAPLSGAVSGSSAGSADRTGSGVPPMEATG